MKKIYALIAAVVVLAAASVAVIICPDRSDSLFYANIEALAQVENGYCYNGGVGASQCEIEAGINIAGFGVSGTCSVTCESGDYACCGVRCICVKY